MILIAQRGSGPRHAEVVARLVRSGHRVVMANSTAEAFDLIPDVYPDVILLEEPEVLRCPNVLCGWIREAIRPTPRMAALVRIDDPAQRARCEACLTVLPPGSSSPAIAATLASLAGPAPEPPPRG